MTPFILKQHEKDRAELKELHDEEISQVSGGRRAINSDIHKLNTVTVTPNGDGGDDGSDEG